MKRTKALLFLTLALCAALLTGCRSNVPNTTDGRVDGTEPIRPHPDGSLGNHDGAVHRNGRQPCRVRKRHDGGF